MAEPGQGFSNDELIAGTVGIGVVALLVAGGGWLTAVAGAQQVLLDHRIVLPPGSGVVDVPHLGALDPARLVVLGASLVVVVALAGWIRRASKARAK